MTQKTDFRAQNLNNPSTLASISQTTMYFYNQYSDGIMRHDLQNSVRNLGAIILSPAWKVALFSSFLRFLSPFITLPLTRRKFHSYSIFQDLLSFSQCPSPSHVILFSAELFGSLLWRDSEIERGLEQTFTVSAYEVKFLCHAKRGFCNVLSIFITYMKKGRENLFKYLPGA